MTEPTTTNKGLIVPNTGDLPGTWGSAALNPDFLAIDGMLGGLVTVGLTNSNVALTAPAGFTASAGPGPTQSQNAILRFTGVLTGACVVTLPLPGFYIIENLCTVGSYYVALASSAPGQIICAPPGEACHVYCDGTNVKYVNMGRIGSYFDMAVSTTPAWMLNCTVPPYLSCDGTVYTATAVYGVGNPAPLLNLLGSTFGGNGITTFGVPDLRNRARISLGGATGRVTTAGSGVDGTTINSSGGLQNQTILKANIPAYNLTVTDPGHTHSIATISVGSFQQGGGGAAVAKVPASGDNTGSATTGITVNTGGSGTPLTTLQPTLVSGLTFIKT